MTKIQLNNSLSKNSSLVPQEISPTHLFQDEGGEKTREVESNLKHIKPKRHARDVFHAWMLNGAQYNGPLSMPILKPVFANPERLIAFSDAMKPKCKDFNQVVHFFEDDCIIERFWSNPKAYVKKLSKFQGVIGLDYSVCWDFPVALKNYNYYRNNVCTYWMQQVFNLAIPQARCETNNYEAVLAGHPKHSTIAIGARSMVRDTDDRTVLKDSIKLVVDYLEPTNLLWYGSIQYGVADYPREMGIPITVYPGKGRGLLSCGHIGGDF